MRAYCKSGLCDVAAPPLVPKAVGNLYEAKLWSQLYYDSIIPFDTRSKAALARAGYAKPDSDFEEMNLQIFC